MRKLNDTNFRYTLPTNYKYIISDFIVCVKYGNNFLDCDCNCNITYYEEYRTLQFDSIHFNTYYQNVMFRKIINDEEIFKNNTNSIYKYNHII